MARIALADDDTAHRELLQHALTANGYDVAAFDDGSELLGAVEAGAVFDLVITDIDMPNLSGLALTEALLAKDPGQPVLIMSGIADELDRAKALAREKVCLVGKPIALDALRGRVAELLG